MHSSVPCVFYEEYEDEAHRDKKMKPFRVIILRKRQTQESGTEMWRCHTDTVVLATTLWNKLFRIFICSNCAHMASLHKHSWCIQHLPLESSCLQNIVYTSSSRKHVNAADISWWHPVLVASYYA